MFHRTRQVELLNHGHHVQVHFLVSFPRLAQTLGELQEASSPLVAAWHDDTRVRGILRDLAPCPPDGFLGILGNLVNLAVIF
jgi:hypothetical protein